MEAFFANQYDQVKWKVPSAIALSDVKSVTFHVADQKIRYFKSV